MRFGLFYEHQLPRPWKRGDELKLFQDALDECEFADKLGFDYVWEVDPRNVAASGGVRFAFVTGVGSRMLRDAPARTSFAANHPHRLV